MSKTPDNLKPSPMTHEVLHFPNPTAQYAALAAGAEEMTRAELDAQAAEAGLDTTAAKTKGGAVETVRRAAGAA